MKSIVVEIAVVLAAQAAFVTSIWGLAPQNAAPMLVRHL